MDFEKLNISVLMISIIKVELSQKSYVVVRHNVTLALFSKIIRYDLTACILTEIRDKKGIAQINYEDNDIKAFHKSVRHPMNL